MAQPQSLSEILARIKEMNQELTGLRTDLGERIRDLRSRESGMASLLTGLNPKGLSEADFAKKQRELSLKVALLRAEREYEELMAEQMEAVEVPFSTLDMTTDFLKRVLRLTPPDTTAKQ